MNQEATRIVKKFFQDKAAISVKKGQVLLQPSEEIEAFYLLLKGSVRQYLVTSEGEEISIHRFRPLSLFPVAQLLGEYENRFYFEADSSCEVKKVSQSEVQRLLKENPAVVMDVASRLAKGIDGLTKRIEQLTSQSAKVRVASLMLFLAQKHGQSQGDKIRISGEWTHSQLATWAGLSRETVTRQLKHLRSDGILGKDADHLVIVNLERLRQMITSPSQSV